jgi:hypothetical protein
MRSAKENLRHIQPMQSKRLPFDAAAVDALPHYGRSLGVIVADSDPNPNDVKSIMLRSRNPFGEWVVTLSSAGIWEVDGQEVGPNTNRQCEMLRSFTAARAAQSSTGGEQGRGVHDLRELQGLAAVLSSR